MGPLQEQYRSLSYQANLSHKRLNINILDLVDHVQLFLQLLTIVIIV